MLTGAGWAIGELVNGMADPLDYAVQAFFVGHRETSRTVAMRAITDLGSSALLIPVAVGAGLLWHRRAGIWRPLLLLVGAYAGAWLLQRTIKALTQVPRPPATEAVGVFSGYAFPSGHATDAAVYGMLAVLLAAALPRRSAKAAVWTVAVVVVGLVGLSRIYLGGHWLTDVLAGFAVGAAWLALLHLATTQPSVLHQSPRTPSARPRLIALSTSGSRLDGKRLHVATRQPHLRARCNSAPWPCPVGPGPLAVAADVPDDIVGQVLVHPGGAASNRPAWRVG